MAVDYPKPPKPNPENRGMIPKDLRRQGISLPILPENSGDFRSKRIKESNWRSYFDHESDAVPLTLIDLIVRGEGVSESTLVSQLVNIDS